MNGVLSGRLQLAYIKTMICTEVILRQNAQVIYTYIGTASAYQTYEGFYLIIPNIIN